MIERGIVHKINGDLILIKCQEDCAACMGCSRSKQEKIFEVLNRRKYPLTLGDQVDIYVSPLSAVKAGFMVLILPLLLFFPFYYTCGMIWKTAADPIKVIAGLGGIVLGFVINFVRKRFNPKQEMPEIWRVVTEDTPEKPSL